VTLGERVSRRCDSLAVARIDDYATVTVTSMLPRPTAAGANGTVSPAVQAALSRMSTIDGFVPVTSACEPSE